MCIFYCKLYGFTVCSMVVDFHFCRVNDCVKFVTTPQYSTVMTISEIIMDFKLYQLCPDSIISMIAWLSYICWYFPIPIFYGFLVVAILCLLILTNQSKISLFLWSSRKVDCATPFLHNTIFITQNFRSWQFKTKASSWKIFPYYPASQCNIFNLLNLFHFLVELALVLTHTFFITFCTYH